MLGSKKGCNLPKTNVDLPAVTEKDKLDLALGVDNKVRFVFRFLVKKSPFSSISHCIKQIVGTYSITGYYVSVSPG